MDPNPQNPHSLAATHPERAQLEVAKLRAEIEHLTRPFWRQPTTWLALFTLSLSLFANAVQFSAAERAKQLAEIRKERLDLDSQRLEERLAKAEAELTKAQAALTAAKKDFDEQSVGLARLQRDIESATLTKQQIAAQIEKLKKAAVAGSNGASLLAALIVLSLGKTDLAAATGAAPPASAPSGRK